MNRFKGTLPFFRQLRAVGDYIILVIADIGCNPTKTSKGRTARRFQLLRFSALFDLHGLIVTQLLGFGSGLLARLLPVFSGKPYEHTRHR